MYPTDNFPFDKVPGGKEYPWARGEYEVLFYEYDDRIIWGLTAGMKKEVCVDIMDQIEKCVRDMLGEYL